MTESKTPILAATDFSQHGQWAVLRAAHLARQRGGSLRLLHAIEDQASWALWRQWFGSDSEVGDVDQVDRARQRLQETSQGVSRQFGIDVECHVETGSAVQHILHAQMGCDLVVIGAQGHSAAKDFLLGTTADRLSRKSTVSVLVVRTEPVGDYLKVLVPFDFSPDADAALERASSMAPQASLQILHACQLDDEGKLRMAGVDEARIEQHRERYRVRARSEIKTAIGSLGRRSDEVAVILGSGSPALTTLEYAERAGVDLIALGKHGRSLIEDTLLGSVTRHVLADAACDVMVVPTLARPPGARARRFGP